MNKSAFTIGLEQLLNNKDVGFLNSGVVFDELKKTTGLRTGDLVREIGKRGKETDLQRSARRLKMFEERHTEMLDK